MKKLLAENIPIENLPLSRKEELFESAFQAVRKLVRNRNYRISIERRPFDGAATGDVDKNTISVRSNMDVETQLFVLLHLLGHCTQFRLGEHDQRIGLEEHKPGHIPPWKLKLVNHYENDASRYGQCLLQEAGFSQLSDWYARTVTADIAFLNDAYSGKVMDEALLDVSGIKALETRKAFYYPTGTVKPLRPLPIPDALGTMDKFTDRERTALERNNRYTALVAKRMGSQGKGVAF